jgi:hypothetical protein
MLYVVTYLTESGDRGVLAALTAEPTDGHISTLVRDRHSGEVEGNTSYLSWEVHKIKIEDLPEPSEILDHI